jgi:putative ABC transport system permease protein
LDRFAKEHPRQYSANYKADIRPLTWDITWDITRNIGGTLYVLFAAAVGVLLVIGCSNVSILLLARGTAPQHEFAVRSAIGAAGFRIARQLLTESLLLAATATAIGIALAYGLLALIVAWLPHHLFPRDVAIRINLPVLVFNAGLALATTVLFGLSRPCRCQNRKLARFYNRVTRKRFYTRNCKNVHSTRLSEKRRIRSW